MTISAKLLLIMMSGFRDVLRLLYRYNNIRETAAMFFDGSNSFKLFCRRSPSDHSHQKYFEF